MKILTVSQNKGGTGKTSTSRLISEFAALKGLSVLCIDLDPQCSLSQRFLAMERVTTSADGVMPPVHPEYEPEVDSEFNGVSSSADVYMGNPVWPYPTKVEGVDIMPGNGEELRRVELVTASEAAKKIHERLREFLADPEIHAQYQLVVIDTSPSKGPLTISAMRAATHVVIPTQMEPQGIEGLQGMLQLWMQENRLREVDDLIKLVGILPNKFRQVGIQEGLLDSLMNDSVTGPMVMPHKLGLRTAFSEADHEDANPATVFKLPESNAARQEAEAVCTYILKSMEVLP